MALRRRDQIPPYEIMRSRGNAGAPGVGAVAPVEDGAERSPNEGMDTHQAAGAASESAANSRADRGTAPWWVGSAAPIVLRIPRGLAVAVIFGVLGLLIVSYWVGTVRGKSAAKADAPPQIAGPNGNAPRQTPEISISNERDPDGDNPETNDRPAMQVFAERREAGLNYLRLLTGNREECIRLAEFMADKRVAIQLVNRDNGEVVVYAVDQGFRGNELSSEEYLAYRRKLQELGRAWRRFNNNRGTDLGTMYPALYKSPGG
ncbi:MAG: hypothetical protein AAGH88_07705 [Planctomycetota bacterium]